MTRNDLAVKRKKLNYIFNKVGEYNSDDGEIDSYLAKYLCILASGFLEDSIRGIYGKFAEGKSHPNVSKYVKSKLRFFQNAKYEDIKQLIFAFNDAWGHDFENFMTEEMRTSINSIVDNKNLLAHGSNSGITYPQLESYWHNSLKILDFIDAQCK